MILSLTQDMMSGHNQNNNNQDLLYLLILLLLLLIILLIVLFFFLLYYLYYGRLPFKKYVLKNRALDPNNKFTSDSTTGTSKDLVDTPSEFPPLTLTPLEKKIIELVWSSHKLTQADIPKLIHVSKSKVSEALSNLEEQRIIERFKAGRSLEIKYIYK